MNKIKAVVFDCDGVMFDTADVNRLYYNQVLEHFNKSPLTEPQFVKVHMFSVNDAIAYLFPEKNDLGDVFAFMKKLAYGKFISHMIIEPDLKDLLDGLKEKAYIRAIATNRTNTMAEVLTCFDLKSRFESVVTAADVKHPKPAPDQLLKIMDQFKLKPKELLFIGDSEFDQMAATDAGAVFIAFNNTSLKADYHFNSMADLKGMFNINQ